MRRIWLVYWDTFWRGIWRFSFTFFLFFSIFWLAFRAVIWGLGVLAAFFPLLPLPDDRPIGIVDRSGLPDALEQLELGEKAVIGFDLVKNANRLTAGTC